MGGHEDGFPFGLDELPQIIGEQTPVAGIESEREIIEDKEVGVLRQYQAEGHLGTLSV